MRLVEVPFSLLPSLDPLTLRSHLTTTTLPQDEQDGDFNTDNLDGGMGFDGGMGGMGGGFGEDV